MSATVIMRELLLARPQVTGKVPAARVFIGQTITNETPMPAILISEIDGNEITTVARNGTHSTIRARVQVTVYAKNYPEQEQVLLACKLPGIPRGIVKGFKVNAVEPMGTGPAIPPAGDGIFERSRDFMVTFKEAN
jgi:hypothetical protein